MSLSQDNAQYRTIAEYEQVVLPQYLRLKDVNLQRVRELILQFWKQEKPASNSLETQLVENEAYYRYNTYFQHEKDGFNGPSKVAISENGVVSLRPAWGHDEREAFWMGEANPRKLIAEQLNAVARYLRANEGLKILLETGAPRLARLMGEKQLLGYLAYFFDCWQRFHEYEQTPPTAKALAGARAATSSPAVADRWAGLLINYTLADLNALLVFAGLLETADPPAVANGTKPGQWVAVAAALYKRNRTRADKAALYRAFSDTYGQDVGSLSTFSREYNEANEAAKLCYDRALSRLG